MTDIPINPNVDTPLGANLDESRLQSELDKLETVVSAALGAGVHSDGELLAALEAYAGIAAPFASEADIQRLSRKMTQRLNIDVERGVAVHAQDFRPWIDEYKRQIDWQRWLAYKRFLLNQKLSPLVVDKMDELTDVILDYVGNPTLEGEWQRRGLVLGDVQSGKTATYLGLFNKAADAGYRLIVVLAGQTESLRRQTQARIDEGVIGRDSVRAPRRGPANGRSNTNYIGVGAIRRDLADAIGMTTVTTDFRLRSLEATNQNLGARPSAPFIFVLKKNKSVLGAVHEWLSTQRTGNSKLQVPLLLLDDEADYASINTGEEADPTAINRAIRDILGLFDRASYLGFTATPFANIFIDHEHDQDLFPRDYIYGLESPTNYVGAARIFGNDRDARSDSPLVYIDDAARFFPPKHKPGLTVVQLPQSLLEALRAYLIANAIRDLRGQVDAPRAMLVNVSRFTKVQSQVHELIQTELIALKNSIEFHSKLYSKGHQNSDLVALEGTFHRHFAKAGVPWPDVLAALPSAVNDIRPRLVNSKTDRKLMDEELADSAPPRYVAVGGDVLSRGLTLGGLTITYFHRQVQASDTLLQMARWFGYRDGYEDLCRIWIDRDATASYEFAADSIAELRATLRRMHDQGETPADYGLAVRKHPGALLITARNKMRWAEERPARISLRTRSIESPKLPRPVEILKSNWGAALVLIREAEGAGSLPVVNGRKNVIWSAVDKSAIARFLGAFKAHPSNALFAPQLAAFVGDTRAPDLQAWDIAMITGQGDEITLPNGFKVNRPQRTSTVQDDDRASVRVSGNSMRVAGREDVAETLSSEVRNAIRSEWVGNQPSDATKIKDPPESEFAARLHRPLILLYPVDPIFEQGAESSKELKDIEALLAVKLAFPRGDVNARSDDDEIVYIVNTVAKNQWFTEFAGDEEQDEFVVG